MSGQRAEPGPLADHWAVSLKNSGKRQTLLRGISVARGCGALSQQPLEGVVGLSSCRGAARQLGLRLCASLEVAVRGRRFGGLFWVDQVAERERPDLVVVAEYLAA